MVRHVNNMTILFILVMLKFTLHDGILINISIQVYVVLFVIVKICWIYLF